MCRKNSEGKIGRRCPSHTEPELVEQRNEVRREQYAAQKTRKQAAETLANAGISFCRGDEVKNEYFQGQDDYDPSKFEAVKDPEITEYHLERNRLGLGVYFQSKPEAGGLWTAPGRVAEDGGIKTAWTDWSHEEQYKVTDTPLSPLRVKKQAVVVQINSAEDLEALRKAFPRPDNAFSYESLASAGIDGVRLSESGLRAAKGAGPDEIMHNFSNWDIDSTVWLSKDSISTGKPIKKAVYEINHDRDDYDGGWDSDYDDDNNSWDFLDKLAAKSQEESDAELQALFASVEKDNSEKGTTPAA